MDSPTTRPSLLVRICNPNDRQSWNEFAQMYHPILLRVASTRGLQHEDAHEIAQEVLIAVMKSIAKFEPGTRPGGFRRWLATITNNKIRDHYRRLRDQSPVRIGAEFELAEIKDESLEAIDESLDKHWQHQLFYMATQVVRPTVQTSTWNAFWRTMVDEVPAEQAAVELGMSLGAVYVARSRVIAKLRQWVERQTKLGMENLL